MPWTAIPFHQGSAAIKQSLSSLLKISGIPSLIVLDCKTGNFISNTARDDVYNQGSKFGEQLIEKWKRKEHVPIDKSTELLSGSSQGGGFLWKMILLFARKPMYIVGMYFLIRKGLNYLEEIGKEEEL